MGEDGYKAYSGEYPEPRCAENRENYPSPTDPVLSRLPTMDQEKAIAKLQDTINQLINRLEPVLSPENEVRVADNTTDKIPSVSPLAYRLDTNNKAIEGADAKLRRIIERIEC